MEFVVQIPKAITVDPAQEAEEFLYIVTHDLKAFARAMREIPSWILEDIESEGCCLPKEAQNNFDMLQAYAERMDNTLNALTKLSRVGRLADAPAPHDLLDLLRSEIATLPASPRLTVDIECHEVSVFGPANDFRSLFHQVMTNSAIHHDREEGHLHISVSAQAGRAHVRIGDDGPGIPPVQRIEMLKPLATLKPKSETGYAGVGLAIAQKVVRLAGGAISFEIDDDRPEVEERGCVVAFDLPLAES